MEGAHDPDCRRCMPWSEIESDENQERIGTINRLIMLRRNEKTCRSPHFHFPNTYENGRCVEYVKIDEEGNKIEVSKDVYQKLNVDSNTNVKKTYMVLDVANPNNNLTDNINDLSIGEYRKLKKVLSKLIDNKNSLSNNSNATIVLNINPLPIKDTNEFSWSYQIEGSNYNNTGGAYQNSEDQLLLAMYKGLYKGLRAIVDNNLNRKNIEVICKKQNILKLTTNVSQENLSRIKNIEAYIENNGLIIKYR